MNGSGEGRRREQDNCACNRNRDGIPRRVPERLSLVAALTLLVLVATLGCGGPGGGEAPGLPGSRPSVETASPENDGTSPGGAGTSPGGGASKKSGDDGKGSGKSGKAKGAPIRIPARIDDQGRPLAEVTAEIDTGVRDQCGGELCLVLRHKQEDVGTLTRCHFVRTEPHQRTLVPRGSTVVIVSGAAPCESEPESPSESESESSPTESPGVPDETPSVHTGRWQHRDRGHRALRPGWVRSGVA